MTEHDADFDELLGRTRCARCGQVLDGEVECPFCSLFPDRTRVRRTPKWVFLTACFLTSPLSLPFVLTTRRLSRAEKVVAGCGMLLWLGVFSLI